MRPRNSPFRPIDGREVTRPGGLLLSEAIANLRAAPVLAVVQMTLAVSSGFLAIWLPANEAARIENDWTRQVSAGSAVFVVSAKSGGSVGAAACDGANSISGVIGAGGIIDRSALDIAQTTAPVDALLVSPGFPSATWFGYQPSGSASVVLPASVAEQLGMGAGDDLVFRWLDGNESAWSLATVDSVPEGRNRVDGINDTVMFVYAGADAVQACYVSGDPTNEAAVRGAVGAHFGANYVVSDFLEDDANLRSPTELFQSRLGPWLVLAMGLGAALFFVIAWMARRSEFALYRALGMRDAEVRGLLALETAIVWLAPMTIGALIGALTLERSAVALSTALYCYGIGCAFVILAPAVGSVLVMRTSPIDTIKGK